MSVFVKMFGKSSAAASTASRAVAKDRLSVILASQRGNELLEGVDMKALQKDVLAVVQVRTYHYLYIMVYCGVTLRMTCKGF